MAETYYIKNMVCGRCIKIVTQILCDLKLENHEVKLGEFQLDRPLNEAQKELLRKQLSSEGLELIDDRKSRMVEKIKLIIQKAVLAEDSPPNKKLSAILKDELHHDYSYLSNLFSSVEGQTIEHYSIALKIEKTKELLVYDELSLSEIAWKLGYSSTAHLSAQFKKHTGLTPSHFKKIGNSRRKGLDSY